MGKTWRTFGRLLAGLLVVLLIGVGANALWLKSVDAQIGYKESWSRADGVVDRGIVYDKATGNSVDLFIPAKASRQRPHGVILFIHGGGWVAGKRTDIEYGARRFAKAGYLTATVDYSLISNRRPEVTMFTMLDDLDKAVAKIKDECARRGFWVNRLALSGTSAGGHLSLLYGYSRGQSAPIPVAFIFAQTGRADFNVRPAQATDKTMASQLSRWTGERFSAEDLRDGTATDTVAAISPVTYIGPKSPPTIYAYGGRDRLVVPRQGEVLGAALKKAGVAHMAIPYPNSDHSLRADPQSQFAYYQAVRLFAKTYFGY